MKALVIILIFFVSCYHPAPEYNNSKQGLLVGYKAYRGYTEVFFVIRSKCMCDTVNVTYLWNKNTDGNYYIPFQKYTINFRDNTAVSFRRNQ